MLALENRQLNSIFERIVEDKNGVLVRVRFTIIEVDGVFRGHVISAEPLVSKVEKEKVDEDYLDDMNCECLENEIRECKEGWVLEGKYCYKDKLYTSSLKACSFYSCQDNRYVEVVV